MLDNDVKRLLAGYPAIYFACHVRHVRDEQTRQQISAHQASILDHLDDTDPTSLNTLAQHMGVTASTMSITVDRLVRDGYVLRERDGVDSRKVCLRLTAAGLRIKRTDKVLDSDLVRILLQSLPPSERADGLHGLEILARAAREMTARRPRRNEKGATS